MRAHATPGRIRPGSQLCHWPALNDLAPLAKPTCSEASQSCSACCSKSKGAVLNSHLQRHHRPALELPSTSPDGQTDAFHVHVQHSTAHHDRAAHFQSDIVSSLIISCFFFGPSGISSHPLPMPLPTTRQAWLALFRSALARRCCCILLAPPPFPSFQSTRDAVARPMSQLSNGKCHL